MVAGLARVVDETASQRIVAAEWQARGLVVRFADGLVCLAPATDVQGGHRSAPTGLALDPKDPSCLIVSFGRRKEHLPWDFLRHFGDAGYRAAASRNMKQTLTHLSRRIRERRQTAELTQQALADRAGLSRATIARLELGSGGVTLATLERIAGALGSTYDSVFGGG